jgi:CRISPR-associated endonuclease/helicase Cas3
MIAPSSAPRSLQLTGVDGTNPLGFLAALGALVTARGAGEADARLRWARLRTWWPVLEGLSTVDPTSFCEVLARGLRGKDVLPGAEDKRVAAERAVEEASTAVRKKLREVKNQGPKGEKRRAAIEAEMRPLEQERDQKRQTWLRALRDAVPRPELALGRRIDCTDEEYRQHASALRVESEHASREPLDLLSAFGSDACRMERSDSVEPTPFCFISGSGHQYFLDTVRQLISQVSPERVRQTLFQPWAYRDEGLSMRWDPIEDRRYALMDRDPTASDNKSRTVWMANLLAYRALALFACAPRQGGLQTTGWTLLDKEQVFTWPIWEFAMSPDTIRSLLQLRELAGRQVDRSRLRARGVVAVLRAHRIKVGAGSNYKLNFSPARAL